MPRLNRDIDLAIKAAMGAVAGGMMLAPDEAEAMYVGPKAKGWGNLPNKFSSLMDRMERAEIGDEGAKLLKQEGQVVPLREALSHPELYKRYPEMADVPVNFYPQRAIGDAWWNRRAMGVGTKDADAFIPAERTDIQKGGILHEIQHAIQEKEGWARGGSPGGVGIFLRAEAERLEARGRELYKQSKQKREIFPELFELGNRAKELRELASFDAIGDTKAYMRLAGEIEARDTAARMGLSATERASRLPFSGQGIPLRDVITKGGGTAASVGEPMIPVADKENLFNQIGKRLIAESQGQGILDNMEDMGKSPLVAAKEFWERTYWKLSSDEQMFFRRQLQNHTGRRDDDIRELLKNQDLPREIEYLEGTDRGYVSLMEYMNQKVTTTKAALKHIPFAPVAIGAAGAMIPFEAGAAPVKPVMTMTDIVNKWRAEGRQIPYLMEREAWREQAQARGMTRGVEEAYGPGDLAADVLTGGASMGARAATKAGMVAIKGGMAAGATGFGLDTATRLLID